MLICFCIPEPTCSCGHGFEDAKHYFCECTNYTGFRICLLSGISAIIPAENITIDVILNGVKLNNTANRDIFNIVHKYITDTRRKLL